MEVERHPEHGLYLRHREAAARYRTAVSAWSGPDRAEAEALLSGLTSLLQAYNRVLWHYFPYCRQCLGGCCVVGATDLKALDYVALALLDEAIPTVPAHTGRDARACIYLSPAGCRWPARWRPLKCALFYCLGSGAIAVDASDARYGEITAALAETIAPRLQRLLPEAAGDLLPLLADPVAFAEALATALDPLLLAPLSEANAEIQPAPGQPSEAAAAILAFIAEATEAAWADPPAPPAGAPLTAEQLLADLETLAWIVEGRPGHAARLLAEMAGRYPLPSGDGPPSLWQQMALQIAELAALG